MTTAGVLPDHQKMEKQMDKQMGCMAGFFQIFDRQQFLAGKRVYATTKRLPAISPPVDATVQSEKSVAQQPPECVKSSAPPPAVPEIYTPTTQKESNDILKTTWKFRETPRLSLDSRVVVDVKGSLHPREIRTKAAISSSTEEDENEKQRRSPSVIARLMGLEALPESTREPLKKPELRRSSSESRSRDLVQHRFIDAMRDAQRSEVKASNLMEKKSNFNSPPWKLQHHQQRKNTQDFFPEPKPKESLFGELEKRLKIRGINEPAEDLETLKQILEALQLKGLLHSSQKRLQTTGNRSRNFIFDSQFSYPETHIVSTKSSHSPRTTGNQTPPPSNLRSKTGIRQNNEKLNLPPVRRRLGRSFNDSERRFSSSISPDRSEINAARSPCSPARRKPLTVETQRRRRNDSVEQRRSCSPVHSPRITSTKNGSDQSPRTYRRSSVEISSPQPSISESSLTTFPQIDTKSRRPKREDYKEGKNYILARCDKLLNSIAELTTTDSQPSPVSVLDSSQLSPLQRGLNDKDKSNELEEGRWSPTVSPVRLKPYDADLVYVSEIIEASNHNYGELDLFCLLEKQRYKSNSSSKSRLHRKLVFDTVTEILERKKTLPPWKAASDIGDATGKSTFKQIWSEFSKLREPFKAEGLFESICGILQKELAGETTNGFTGKCTVEMSEMVLDIERLIFKDLIGDIIQDLATFTEKSRGLAPKRLVF